MYEHIVLWCKLGDRFTKRGSEPANYDTVFRETHLEVC